MRLVKAILVCTGVVAAAMVGSAIMSTSAEAAVCRARMSGQGTGLGIAGQGTNAARSNALADWARQVQARHGARFANTALARAVRYDCRQGAVLEAKCVVSAVPCAPSPPPRAKSKRKRR
jgi:hypothetical protein